MARSAEPIPPPRLRADAQRNHDALVEAARQVFTERGPGAPLDEVARAAGVGNATMYRHFPTRQDLIIRVYAEEVRTLRNRAEELATGDAPGEALFVWLREFIRHVATKRELALALPENDSGRSTLFDAWHKSMQASAQLLLKKAQAVGAVRRKVVAADLLTLASGLALTLGDSNDVERFLTLIRTGISP